MLNKIWFWLLVIGIVFGAGKAVYYASQGKYVPGDAPKPERRELADYPPDCNANGVPDAVEVADGRAADVNRNAIPDSCEADCNTNGIPDDFEIREGSVADANGNGVPDPCEKSVAATEVMRSAGERLTTEALESAEIAVGICISLIGVMTLWLGLMNIARKAGLIDALAKVLRPVLRWVFPSIPDGHPAQGAILMNLAANMLGMGNAATPFGLKAMEELQTLNPKKKTATNAMAMFLAINTSSVTLIPITLIGIRIGVGSKTPAAPMVGLIMVTTVSTIVGITAARLLSRLPRYAPQPETDLPNTDEENGEGVE